MSDDQKRQVGNEPNIRKRPLLIGDLVRYLSRMARLNKDQHTGNVEVSRALQGLARALQPHSHRPIREVSDIVAESPHSTGSRKAYREPKATLPEDLQMISGQGVEAILDNHDFTKRQLVELGYQRFGISQSKLRSSRKDEVIESIRAALNHERSLGVISQEARRSGEQRLS